MLDRFRARHPGSPLPSLLLYEAGRLLLLASFRLFYRLKWSGAERVPASGPVLLVANHQSFLDPPLVGVPVRQRQLDFLARSGLFHSRMFGGLISALHATPVRQERGDAAGVREVLKRLGEGRAVLVFPEGSRSPDGVMRPFKRGAAMLVRRARCPVVPVAIVGAFEAWPRQKKWPRLRGQRVRLAYGHPIAHDELLADGPDAAVSRLAAEITRMRLDLQARWSAAEGGAPE